MNMIQKVFLMAFITLLVSCKSNIVDVEKLDKSNIRFSELPMAIKDTLLELSKPKHYFEEKQDLLCLTGNYILEIKEIGPWIDHMLIVDVGRNIKYKLKRGPGKPFVIYENNLYISDSYNMLVVKDIYKLNFTKFKLRSKK
jgi:hypothetical protein